MAKSKNKYLNNKFSFLIILFLSFQISFSQTEISLEKENGIYKIPCLVNGIPMKFIFDTGASNVSISTTEANFLYKQGLLLEEDFVEKINYQIANGEIVEGIKINLKSIDINGYTIKNIIAIVTDKQNSPLLLGQSAIERFGKYSINGNKLILNDSLILNKTSDNTKETLNWINQKFKENKKWDDNFIDGIQIIDNEPLLIIFSKSKSAKEEQVICHKIPLKKTKPISFEIISMMDENDAYCLKFKTKNGEEVVWWQDEDLPIGQIGDWDQIYLNLTIENDDLMNRLKKAFSYLMGLYGNDGKEKF